MIHGLDRFQFVYRLQKVDTNSSSAAALEQMKRIKQTATLFIRLCKCLCLTNHAAYGTLPHNPKVGVGDPGHLGEPLEVTQTNSFIMNDY